MWNRLALNYETKFYLTNEIIRMKAFNCVKEFSLTKSHLNLITVLNQSPRLVLNYEETL
jgi:hypothetical protein